MTKLLAVALSLSILTRSGDAQVPATAQLRAEWHSLVSHLPIDSVKTATALESFRQRRGLLFSLWADSTVDTTQYSLADAACGTVASVFLQTLPLTTHPLTVELAVEIDSTGRFLQRWPMPLDTRVHGIAGGVLFVPYWLWTGTESRAVADLAIQPSGAIQVVPPRVSVPPPESLDCPPIDVFRGSAYTTCERLADMVTKKRRVIAYQLPCT